MTIIGIAGAAGAGKDTVADVLVAELAFTKDKFARPLKEILNNLFGWRMENWDDPEWKELPNAACGMHTPRYVAQTFGTDWGRNTIYPDIWVDAAMRGVVSDRTVFSDVRFPNELAAIREAGGKLIFVEVSSGLSTLTEGSQHESESFLRVMRKEADAVLSMPRGHIEQLRILAFDTARQMLESANG